MKRMILSSGPLKTMKGSVIKRCPRYGVGKEIGGKIYFHLQYALDIVPKHEWDLACDILDSVGQDQVNFNIGVYDPKEKTLRFVECPDFDTAREPVVGHYITVDLKPTGQNNYNVKEGNSNTIYHHKWLFVKDDYQGFDVDESHEWSRKWLSMLPEKADGTNQQRWLAQLKKYNIE